MEEIVLIVLAVAAASFAAYQWAEARRWRHSAAAAEEKTTQQQARLEVALVAEAKLQALSETGNALEERFERLASEALQQNGQLFLERSRDQMQHLIDPVNVSLRRFDEQVQALELKRAGAYEGLSTQVRSLVDLQERVRQSADDLKTALRSPSQRGQWGEMQLRRVVELAGMIEHCDFAVQKTLFGESNQRPDLIIHLPNQCQVVVDAKVSLEAYLRAVEAKNDADRDRLFADHARQVRTHVRALGEKAYWQRLSCSPEFVVAFLPLESLYSAALDHDPELIHFGVKQRVLLATPATLITLLLTVAHGWSQQNLAENVDRIRQAGVELYGRLGNVHGHFAKLGDAIEKTVAAYNTTVGSLEQNVLPSARRFRDLQPANTPVLAEPGEVESQPRKLRDERWGIVGIASDDELRQHPLLP